MTLPLTGGRGGALPAGVVNGLQIGGIGQLTARVLGKLSQPLSRFASPVIMRPWQQN